MLMSDRKEQKDETNLQMDAIILRGPQSFALERVPIPKPGMHEVLCRVEGVFICGTDPHIIHGDYPGFWPRTYPFIPGHEWSGVVVEVGEGAAALGWHIGERVAGTSHCGCGYCRMCLSGRYNLCENYGSEVVGHRQYGHYSQGAYAQYVVHSVKSVFRVPDTLPLEEAAGMDPASIALHTVKRAKVGPGDSVAVLGPGPMGLLVLQCARAVGAGRVLVVGRGSRLAVASELGAEVVDYTSTDPVAEVRRLTAGGPQCVIECAGTAAALAQALEMCRKGGNISVIGIPLQPGTLPIQKLVLEEISLHGVRANRGTCAEVLPLLTSGRVTLRPLITHTFPLCDFARALQTFLDRQSGALKVLLRPWG
jgi:L-iditol 2-dehydrogenase